MKTGFPPNVSPPGRCRDCGPRFGGQIVTIKREFEAFLSQNSFRPIHILPGAQPAVRAIARENDVLQRRLGDAFLGVSLGGSLIHGLGTVQTSDVDYSIYTRQIGEKTAESVKHESWYRLRNAGLAPCDGDPVCDLERRPIRELTSALTVFSCEVIAPNRAKLEQAALDLIKAAIGENLVSKQELFALLKEEYSRLVATDPAYAAKKFMQNRAPEFIMEGAAIALSFDEKFMGEMTGIAKDYMQGRARYCPFPAQVEALFRL